MTINGIVCKSADEQRTAIKTLLIVASIYWQVVANGKTKPSKRIAEI